MIAIYVDQYTVHCVILQLSHYEKQKVGDMTLGSIVYL